MERESQNGDGERLAPASTGLNGQFSDFVQLVGWTARRVDAQKTLEQTRNALVKAAVDVIPGAEAGGVAEVCGRGQGLDGRYATDPLAADLDTAQYELREGPCLDAAYRHRRTVRVTSFKTERRWPAFTVRARERGAGSMLAIQLYVRGDDLGALNLYSRLPEAFDDDSEQVGLMFATHGSISLSRARRERQLREAIITRDVIGQAKGILMERSKITSDQAFSILVRASGEKDMKLRDVAEALTHTGEVPRRHPQ